MTVALFSATDETAISCDSLCLDPFEAGMLPVLRHLLTSLQVPESQAWQHAFQIAAERWGASFGLGVAQAWCRWWRDCTLCAAKGWNCTIRWISINGTG